LFGSFEKQRAGNDGGEMNTQEKLGVRQQTNRDEHEHPRHFNALPQSISKLVRLLENKGPKPKSK